MNTSSTPQSVGFARLFWMIVGPGVLLLLAFSIATRGNGWLTPVDIAFLAILPLVLAARWFEFHHGDPHTATGDPATPADLRKYGDARRFAQVSRRRVAAGVGRVGLGQLARQPLACALTKLHPCCRGWLGHSVGGAPVTELVRPPHPRPLSRKGRTGGD